MHVHCLPRNCVCTALHDCTKLCLVLCEVGLGDEAARHAAHLVRASDSLTRLSLCHNCIGTLGMAALGMCTACGTACARHERGVWAACALHCVCTACALHLHGRRGAPGQPIAHTHRPARQPLR